MYLGEFLPGEAVLIPAAYHSDQGALVAPDPLGCRVRNPAGTWADATSAPAQADSKTGWYVASYTLAEDAAPGQWIAFVYGTVATAKAVATPYSWRVVTKRAEALNQPGTDYAKPGDTMVPSVVPDNASAQAAASSAAAAAGSAAASAADAAALVLRITAERAAYLDNLSEGPVALESSVQDTATQEAVDDLALALVGVPGLVWTYADRTVTGHEVPAGWVAITPATLGTDGEALGVVQPLGLLTASVGGAVIAGTTADADGDYTLYVPPDSTWALRSVAAGYTTMEAEVTT